MEAYLDDGRDKHYLTGTVTVIGRDRRSCNLVFDDELMSRRHAYIVERPPGDGQPGGYWLLDINSSNGVSVNGHLVDYQLLEDGDKVTLGGLRLTFHCQADEPEAAPPPALQAGGGAGGDPKHSSAEFVRVLKEKTLVFPGVSSKQALRSDFDKLLILYKVNRLVTSETDLDGLLNKVVDLAMEVLDADRVTIMFRTREGLVPKIQRARDREQIESGLLHISQSISEFCLAKGEPVITQDALVDQRFQKSGSIQMYNIRSAMCSPLMNREESFGVLYVDNRIHGDCFSEDDLRLLEAFADSVSIAIVNSRLIYELKKSLSQVKQQQEVLIQTEKLAAMGQLSAGISHEIRGPLTAISGYVQFYFSKFQEGAPFYDKMQRINEALDSINAIVGGLLDLARKGEKRSEPVDLVQVMESTLRIAERSLTKVGAIQVKREFSPGLPEVIGDQRQLQQVFLNLMLNAAQAMTQGGVLSLGVRPGRVTHQGPGGVEVIVQDTGVGMDETTRQQIFQPFFTSGKKGGTGLGLAITKNIVELHGAEIEVESAPGRGTRFTVRFPCGEQAAAAADPAARAGAPADGRPPSDPPADGHPSSDPPADPSPAETRSDFQLPDPGGQDPGDTRPELDVSRITRSGSISRTRSGGVLISNLTDSDPAGGGER